MLKARPADLNRGAAQVAPFIQLPAPRARPGPGRRTALVRGIIRTAGAALAACAIWALVCHVVPAPAAAEAQPEAVYADPYFGTDRAHTA